MRISFLLRCIVCVILFPFLSCQEKKNVEEFSWLIGKWQGTMHGMAVHEIWSAYDAVLMNGEGIALSGTDTMFHEITKIEMKEDGIHYTATVPGNPGPVSFKLTSSEKNKAVFENPQHDFPKVITYELHTSDSLTATVEGDEGGKHKKEVLHFKRSV